MTAKRDRLLRRAAFLDRDGVINRDTGYVYRIEDFHFLPGVFEAALSLQNAGYELVIVTNQSGIARRYFTEGDFIQLNNYMLSRFSRRGVHILATYHCPHHESLGPDLCDCRKPKPGMILRAAAEFALNLPTSVLFGDKASDIEAGVAAGVGHCVRIFTESAPNIPKPHPKSLRTAVENFLSKER